MVVTQGERFHIKCIQNAVEQADQHAQTLKNALGALGVQSLTAHPGPGSSEAHPAGRMIGIGLRAGEP